MNSVKQLFLFIPCLFFCLSSFAQDKIITGNVSASESNTPLAGVTVTVKETSASTLTDGSGSFSITAKTGQVLHFSYVGYANKEIVIGEKSSVSVSLNTSEANTLQDVVVVGYGTQKKANLTGAVTTVDVGKTFGSKPLNDPPRLYRVWFPA